MTARTAIDAALANATGRSRPRGDLPVEPRRRLAVLTCMDARLDPLSDLGLSAADAHILRNAGGRVTGDVLRSLLLSWHTLGTREVLVIHHTGCGARVDDEAQLRSRLEEVTGAALGDLDLHTFADDEEAVRDDVARIRAVPFAPDGLVVRGALQDIDTGRILEVPPDDGSVTDVRASDDRGATPAGESDER